MKNYLYYCKDYEKFRENQDWIKTISNVNLNFKAKRDENSSWEVYFLHGGNRYSIKFNAKFDYLPSSYDKYPDYKYWTFPEVQREIEQMATNMLRISHCLS